MNRKILTLLFICALYFNTSAQDEGKDYVVGTSHIIQSYILNDEREIQVYLPEGYSASEEKYPVLYVLDGQRYFLHAVSLQKSFIEFKETLGFIIVGISKKRSDRNRNFNVNSESYLEFIKKEVIELVDASWRTAEERLLFGWAFGGGFVLETMTVEPDLFDAYIAASPFPLTGKINKVDSLLTNVPSFDKQLFFSSGTNEGVVKEGTSQLNSLLKDKAPETMPWEFRELVGEEHRSTPFTTLYHGIKKYFSYYPELQFNNLAEFMNAGGLDYVYEYYEKRALKYGFPKALSDWTMFSITRNAIRANDYAQFDTLVNEFNKTNFMERLRVNRACSIAAFYLDYDQPNRALELYGLLAEKHKSSALPMKGLGDSYKKMNMDSKAEIHYKKAEALTREGN